MTRASSQMKDVERLLSETLDTYAADTSVAPDGLDGIAAKRARRRFRPGVLPGLAVAGATLALGLGAIVLANAGDRVTRGPDVLGQPGSAGPLERWQRVSLDGMGEHDCGAAIDASCARLVDAAPLGEGGFVVVGNIGVTPVVHVTADGSRWSDAIRLPLPDEATQASVEAVATDGERFVAVGMSYPLGPEHPIARAGVVWLSADGTAWERVDLGVLVGGAALTDVARNGQGFVATGLVAGGRVDRVDLATFSSVDGRTWAFDGYVGRPLPVAGTLPVVGVEAGAGTVVYAEIANPGADRACGHRGVALFVGGKDGVPTLGENSDSPARAGTQTASAGLEAAVLRPCGAVETDDRPEGGAGARSIVDTTVSPLRPGVTWDGGQPTVFLYAATEPPDAGQPGAMVRDAVVQLTFRSDGDGWRAEPFAHEQHLELVGPGVATDGFRLGVAAVDGTVESEDGRHRATHLPGDGAGSNLGFLIDDGGGWTHAGPADPQERQRLGYGTFAARPCEGPGWGHGAVGARAVAVSGGHVLIVGRATDCLHRFADGGVVGSPFVPTVWVGPLP